MSDDEPIPSVDAYNDGFSGKCPTCGQPYLAAEVHRLRARIAELEASAAITFGTLEQPTPDWPTTIEHNIPPNAPPHDE